MKMLEALFESSRVAARQGKPLRLWQAAVIVIAISGAVLLYAMEGIHDILVGRKHHALLYCGVAAFILMTWPIHVFNVMRVKQGVKVIAPNPLLVFGWLRVPLSVKVALVGSLTILVAVVSYSSLLSLYSTSLHYASKMLMFTAGFNLFLWVAVAFAWYLFVMSYEQEPQKIEPALEQGKGVWPPAPSVSSDPSKIDESLR